LEIKLKDCGYYNNKGEYLLEPGNFRIMVGGSSKDIYFNKTIVTTQVHSFNLE
jgi:hypothetical protein